MNLFLFSYDRNPVGNQKEKPAQRFFFVDIFVDANKNGFFCYIDFCFILLNYLFVRMCTCVLPELNNDDMKKASLTRA